MSVPLLLLVAAGAALLWFMTSRRGGVRRPDSGPPRNERREPVPIANQRKVLADPALARVASISDPVMLASIVMVAVATDDAPLQPEQEAALDEAISSIAPADQVAEAAVQGRLTAEQVRDPFTLMDIAADTLRSVLDEREKHQLVEMVRLVATDGGAPPARLDVMLRHLQRSIGLQVRQS